MTDLALNPNHIVPVVPSGDFSLREEAETRFNNEGFIEGNLDVFRDSRPLSTLGKVSASYNNGIVTSNGSGSLLLDPQPLGKALVSFETSVKKGTVTLEILVKRIRNEKGILRLQANSLDGEFEIGAYLQAQDLPLNQWATIAGSGVCQNDGTKLHLAVQISDGDSLILIDDLTVRQIQEPAAGFDPAFYGLGDF